ncbi:hydrogen peroxide-inducible genes activator [Komagataeibacter rhaeticus]|uniref:Hydrogen peroxide-inducible genes activator n=1 Tax=Komagataeibacter rhaeticus TaxID=215221 RepID=A0A181CA02_9PROT|nr:hydrogen peroxide-inducible genes activator [Komagataeibacter rhaeticus]ATU73068.1 hydrogen peroxide-inducible genes activator [Komagataeibacter xylinus]EGG77101.1 Hydrogen peroxide-inducible activator [Gluconacetobacter sp. SXCC-1]KDU97477.1 LysR family transcriptional regulator [Komagataeibacter rhaeticus AF1]MBL7239028.1 hydrogen peroxide-inducible genes activator [Komagataeibacter rhaeticus]PYD54290.1 hydrogen peroxide-inducible genes activator [Komagataeibacter rhaeticus]
MSYIPLSGLSLRDIEYVVAVDDLRNFSRAAERCGVSQGGLSEQVRKLEALLGVVLFERSRRHVAPTPDGARLIALGRDVLAAARAMIEAARVQTGPLAGLLRIGVIATLGPYYVPDLLPLLRGTYPQLRLQLTDSLTDTMLGMLRHDALDMVFAALPVSGDGFTCAPLFDEPFVAAFPAEHPLARRQPLAMADLNGPDLLLLEDGHCLRDQALALCGMSPRHARQRLATSLEMLWHMIGAGEGYSLIPRLALRNRQAWQELITLTPLPGASRTIGLVWRASDPRGAAFAEFARFLREHTPDGCTPAALPPHAGSDNA